MTTELDALISAIASPVRLPSSLIGKVRFLRPAIEKALKSGYKFADIAVLMADFGCDVTAAQLSATMRKIRMADNAGGGGDVKDKGVATVQPGFSNKITVEKLEEVGNVSEANSPPTTPTGEFKSSLPSAVIDAEIDIDKYRDD